MAAPGAWTTGLCGCSEDCSVCCFTCCCPCIAFGRIAEIVDKGNNDAVIPFNMEIIGSADMKKQLAVQHYMLPARPCHDCLVHCCCLYCALCQEYRELKNRGIDPSLGWQGALKPPVGPGEMRR
ncbi:PLAC8 motif-containing protein [Tanacetum coccineum]